MYTGGWGVPQDLAQAANWYRKAADLDVRYKEGRLVPKDGTEAASWYRQAISGVYALASKAFRSK